MFIFETENWLLVRSYYLLRIYRVLDIILNFLQKQNEKIMEFLKNMPRYAIRNQF